ncbi:MAG: class I SAM-dependent methyltransferase [Thermoplasmata archaeon]
MRRMDARKRAVTELPQFPPTARLAYRYRWRLLGWLLDEHAFLREAFLRAWPRAVHRELVVTERVVEIPFVLRSLRLPPGSRVLDVGSRWSVLPLHLVALGYRAVAVDLDEVLLGRSGPDLVKADLRAPPFRPDSFDAAVMVSTLEHVGIGWYDARTDIDDDLRMMRELRTLVKPGGRLLITVPFGRGGVGRTQRAYDRDRLRAITEGWALEERSFFVKRGMGWQPAAEETAEREDSVDVTHAVALIHLRRPDGGPTHPATASS